MTLLLRCKDCGKTLEYVPEPDQSMYGAAYIAGARHEKDTEGARCCINGARNLVLVGVKDLEKGER